MTPGACFQGAAAGTASNASSAEGITLLQGYLTFASEPPLTKQVPLGWAATLSTHESCPAKPYNNEPSIALRFLSSRRLVPEASGMAI